MNTSPATDRFDEIAATCRRQVRRKALIAAGVAVVPVPGLDWIADVGTVMRLIPDINRAFGLSPEQVARLSPDRQAWLLQALSTGGGAWVGRVVTRTVVMFLLRRVGVRLSAQQAVKFVPIAGQAVSAMLTFAALRHVCDRHIAQCVAISRQISCEDGQFPG